MKQLTLEIITQERHLETETIASVTAPTQLGHITILSGHVPLFARLSEGELNYKTPSGREAFFAVTGGFIDVSPRNIVTILADSAIRSDQINLEKAEAAVVSAKKALAQADEEKTTLKLERELRSALLQTKLAKKTRSRVTR